MRICKVESDTLGEFLLLLLAHNISQLQCSGEGCRRNLISRFKPLLAADTLLK